MISWVKLLRGEFFLHCLVSLFFGNYLSLAVMFLFLSFIPILLLEEALFGALFIYGGVLLFDLVTISFGVVTFNIAPIFLFSGLFVSKVVVHALAHD